jgi:cytochrome d ubiquinol oxidase subunit I
VLFLTFFVFAKKWLQQGPDLALPLPDAAHATGY